MPLAAQNQKFSIANLYEDSQDLSARQPEYERLDGNGDRFSIIKVKSDAADDELTAYSFNFGQMESQLQPMPQLGELWVYVQRGAKHVTISRSGFKTINKYDLGLTVGEGVVYVMELSVESRPKAQQAVFFKAQPDAVGAQVMCKKDARNAVEKEVGQIDEYGELAVVLEQGKYFYRILSDAFHPLEGTFELNGSDTHEVTLALRSRGGTGMLKITSNPDGANISIDGVSRGLTPYSGNLLSGQHRVEISKSGYDTVTKTVYVRANGTVNEEIALAQNFETSKVQVNSSPEGATVELDGNYVGVTPCSIDIPLGEHTIKVSKEGYKSDSKELSIYDTNNRNVSFYLYRRVGVTERISDAASESADFISDVADDISDWEVWEYINFGLNASLDFGGIPSDATVSEVENYGAPLFDPSLFTMGLGAQIRIGTSENWFNFIGGAKYLFAVSEENIHQVVFPMVLNWNLLRDIDGALYVGMGYEPGIMLSSYEEYTSSELLPSNDVIMQMGFANRHWDWSFGMKINVNSTYILFGTSLSYYF